MRIGTRWTCFLLLVATAAIHVAARAAEPITCGWDNGAFDSAPPAISARAVAWTGQHLFVWGRSPIGPAAGWLYDPSANQWTRTSETAAPEEFSGTAAVWTGSEILLWNNSDTRTMLAKYDPVNDTWSSGSLSGAPSSRYSESVFWTGSELIVWGGKNGLFRHTDGARYDPESDTWTAMSTVDVPQGRSFHSTVWTGSSMIVWGGQGTGGYLNDGGLYDPVADTWSPISLTGAPSPRVDLSAVWTGTEMIVWGGWLSGTGTAGDGARYDPTADEWTPVSSVGAPAPRTLHQSVWAVFEMIVWGGKDAARDPLHDGARYDPANDIWLPVAPSDAPAANHDATWTGDEMIVIGNSVVGGRYDPATDAWTPTYDPGMPPYGTLGSYAGVWTGTELIVWGSNWDGVQGGRYNLELDQWLPMSMEGAPSARTDHTAVWTGSEMIVWGGFTTNTGGRYNPATDSWTPTSLLNAPQGRALHSAVWTGTEMIVSGGVSAWPGNCPGDTLASSRAYDPATDTWRGAGVIGGRAGHTAVWTGTEVIFWGGHVGGMDESGYCAFADSLNSGSRYDPVTDESTPLSTTGMPQHSSHGTAVWTGAEMIVWGGYWYIESGGASIWTRDGGRYSPSTDSWQPVSTDGAPVRADHMAVWTGNEMIVWGGVGNDVVVNGIYSPTVDRWTPIAIERQPDFFSLNSAVWTGDMMVVWNGHGGRFRIGMTDGDGDGMICGDNCPLTANPDQLDSDSDGLGDACDACFGSGPDTDGDAWCDDADNCAAGPNAQQADTDADGVGNLCDICPLDSDAPQADTDGDGAGDLCDCQPGDAGDLAPGTIDSLAVSRTDPATARFDWVLQPGADAYAIHRGLLSTLAPGEHGGCFDEIVATTSFSDPELPSPGDGFTYLIQGQNFDCGLGALGFGEFEEPRFNDDPGACAGVTVSDTRANGEASVVGVPSGTYVDTLASDDGAQTITEEESGGNPSNRISYLEHHWHFTVPAGQAVELHVEGYRSASADGDDFAFEYSVDGGSVWNAIALGSLPLADEDRDQVVLLPTIAAGNLTIRVVDSDRTPGNRELDSVSIDEILLRVLLP